MTEETSEHARLPRHIAIVMDGNGRWAVKRGLSRYIGHEQGAKVAEEIVRYASELGISHITLYAFSTENWQRPAVEVDAIMHILERYLKNDANELLKNDIKINAIGDLSRLPQYLSSAVTEVLEKTKNCKKLVITLALSYGAWEEVARACTEIALHSAKQKKPVVVDEKMLRSHLYTHDLPDPDLLIRCGGEYRLSNFLLMQLSYAELYFCPTLWPDFKRSDLDLALKSFERRHRRYGGTAKE